MAMTNLAEDLIKQRGRVTPARLQVLEILLQAEHALSHGEIEARLPEGAHLDRVTLYRILDWLVSEGIAHRIAGEDRAWRFNAALPDAPGQTRSHSHAHFHCRRCGQIFCLDQLQPVFSFSLPAGFRFEGAELTLNGVCPHCQ